MSAENSDISGVLVLDKSAGMTSHDAVSRIRRLFNTRQVGHTGTLDPIATGVLVMLLGRAAKASDFVQAGRKAYTATLRLGVKTDTGDITGNIIAESAEIPSFAAVESVLPDFTGEISQIPPMYSAIKIGGKKLYEIARLGMEVERQPRSITVYRLTATRTERADEIILRVECSKGTYIRSLCEDIGEALGCHGTMAALRRDSTGGFSIDEAYTLDRLDALDYSERLRLLRPTESLFEALPRVTLNGFFARLMRDGAEIYQRKIGTAYESGELLALYDGKVFVALGEVRDYPGGSAIKPIKMFTITHQ